MGEADTMAPGRMKDLVRAMDEAVTAVEVYVDAATRSARSSLSLPDGKPDRAAFERHQHRAHGLSWVATYLETLRQTAGWAARLEAEGRFGEIEALLSQILFGEYCAQLIGGVPMNQGEIVRPADLGCSTSEMQLLFARPIVELPDAVVDLVERPETGVDGKAGKLDRFRGVVAPAAWTGR